MKMNRKYKRIVIRLIIILIFKTSVTNSQAINTREYYVVDSVQKMMLKDSLKISDTLTEQIFAIRDNYYQKVSQIRLNNQLNEQQQNNQVKLLRKLNVENIKELMGTSLYIKYSGLIKNRMNKKNVTGNVLTED